jgi:hypothetical protein
MLRPLVIGCFLVVFLAAHAEGRIALPQPRPRLQFELLDGTKIYGQAVEADASLKLATSYGEVRVSLVQLRRIELPDYSGQAILHFANGERLKGTLPAGIEVQTHQGRITVPVAKVRSLRVIPISYRRLKAAGIHVSGKYPPQPPEYAVDGVPGAWSSGDWKGWYEIDLGSRTDVSRLSITLQFDPTGPATHEFYISDEPMGATRDKGKLLHRFSGERKNEEVLTFDCPPGTTGRYVQVHCPESTSWFNLIEFEVFASE